MSARSKSTTTTKTSKSFDYSNAMSSSSPRTSSPFLTYPSAYTSDPFPYSQTASHFSHHYHPATTASCVPTAAMCDYPFASTSGQCGGYGGDDDFNIGERAYHRSGYEPTNASMYGPCYGPTAADMYGHSYYGPTASDMYGRYDPTAADPFGHYRGASAHALEPYASTSMNFVPSTEYMKRMFIPGSYASIPSANSATETFNRMGCDALKLGAYGGLVSMGLNGAFGGNYRQPEP